MSVYNGGKYLKEQIDSIICQTYDNWTLYIHDDGSIDNSVSIIQKYCSDDKRIVLYNNLEEHLGPALAFMKMVEEIDSTLYMFCDQDDVWLKDKIRITYERYCLIGQAKTKPVVIHTDVSVVDEELNVMASSYWKDINMNPDKINRYEYLCVSCYTNGNTMLFNSKAKSLCFPMINNIIMHDKYVSSRVLKNNGVVVAIHEPLVLYRQHGSNVCGFTVGKENKVLTKLKNISVVINSNIHGYRSLKDYEFGNFIKYLYYKFLLEWHMHVKKNY